MQASTNTVNTKCPATNDVTGGLMQRARIINRCHTSDTFAQAHGALDAPEYIARGSVQGHLLKADEFGPEKHYISHTEWRRQW